ncbi:Aste57867_1444 [Aphanomyces stellatus]|uniref:Aste57867_1444 protein n=1 Tax=Aphanomyces stellatus TaxID=120398 RepID=A0A485K7V2_9STRA|nr:hypothetical protein As57867_001443 [Aphanomyces stellatus]VFT78661.1 Aste57867_1444 [Aphanomyces stellatus]
MDDGSLVKVLNNARSVNSQLMKTNLGLLMSIRETDCEIVRAKEQLQKYHTELQRRGMGIGLDCNVHQKAPPQSSAAFDERRNNTSRSGKRQEDTATNEDDDDDDDQNTDSSSDSSSNE